MGGRTGPGRLDFARDLGIGFGPKSRKERKLSFSESVIFFWESVIFLISARLITPLAEHAKRVQSNSPPPFMRLSIFEWG
jgi:hypothetical protein